MTRNLLVFISSTAYRQVSIAAIFGLIIAAILTCINYQQGYSFLIGTLLWAIPCFYFAGRIFKKMGTVSSPKMLSIFYHAEIEKILFVGIFFILLTRLISISVVAVVCGYLVTNIFFGCFSLCKQGKLSKS